MTDGAHQYCMYKRGNIIDAQPWYIYISHGVTTTLHPVVDEAIDIKPPVLQQYARIWHADKHWRTIPISRPTYTLRTLPQRNLKHTYNPLYTPVYNLHPKRDKHDAYTSMIDEWCILTTRLQTP